MMKKILKIILLILLTIAGASIIKAHRFLFSGNYQADGLRLRAFWETALFYYIYVVWAVIVIVIARMLYKWVSESVRKGIIALSIVALLVIGASWFMHGFGLEISQGKEINVYGDGIVLVKKEDWLGSAYGYSYMKIENKIFIRDMTPAEAHEAIKLHGELPPDSSQYSYFSDLFADTPSKIIVHGFDETDYIIEDVVQLGTITNTLSHCSYWVVPEDDHIEGFYMLDILYDDKTISIGVDNKHLAYNGEQYMVTEGSLSKVVSIIESVIGD
ncbi:hypothetical protein SAMN02910384_02225 [Pseudobutyrivibrio sp. ACV-2]|uniref:hypothetical protein n=1 Tax=Pseudobutyrivibrio sp. ACV-2 TaxID=1520801 RepID=UPI00089AF304|nr:hypothetical protein [Pseudobutyrivibrio sp. ACV-2]SEA73800.1 hypothetical protein SAMN02910384_02225 [Pseudobutyrivibrio sp. ACV-2]